MPNWRVVARRKKNFAHKAVEYSSLALMLPAGTFSGYLIGYWLDRQFGTTWLCILLLILGSAGGFIELIRQILRDSRDDDA